MFGYEWVDEKWRECQPSILSSNFFILAPWCGIFVHRTNEFLPATRDGSSSSSVDVMTTKSLTECFYHYYFSDYSCNLLPLFSRANLFSPQGTLCIDMVHRRSCGTLLLRTQVGQGAHCRTDQPLVSQRYWGHCQNNLTAFCLCSLFSGSESTRAPAVFPLLSRLFLNFLPGFYPPPPPPPPPPLRPGGCPRFLAVSWILLTR